MPGETSGEVMPLRKGQSRLRRGQFRLRRANIDNREREHREVRCAHERRERGPVTGEMRRNAGKDRAGTQGCLRQEAI